jgi:hypothetical protein
VGVIATLNPVTSVKVDDDKLNVSVFMVLTTWRIRKAPRSKFMFAAVRTSPAVKLLGKAVGVGMATSS